MRRAAPALLAAAACHPLSMFHPPELSSRAAGEGRVQVIVDRMGVPHILAEGEPDLAYGLGFMHARDRLFQLMLIKHAALGRLAEIFGEPLLETDRRLRLVSWGLQAQYRALSERDRAIAEAYAAGVNAGARHAGRSAEMALLGVEFEPFTGEDALAVARLQAWDLAADFRDELARSRILARLPDGDPRRALFLAPMPSGGVPIVRKEENTARTPRLLDAALAGASAYAQQADDAHALRTPAPRRGGRGADRTPRRREEGAAPLFESGEPGASNSWVVHGSRTASGRAVLCNDPHLAHRLPGVFYLAHLESPDFAVVGVTFPGVPAVLIGATRHLAWGMTTSVTDMQDLVRITPDPNDPEAYLLDGAPVKFEKKEQVFRVGHGDKARVEKEVWLATEFGPVVPKGYEADMEKDDLLALMWPGFWAREGNAEPIGGFWDLARARNAAEAGEAVAKISVSAQNVTLAFTDGSIAYRLAALVPVRKSPDTNLAPRDGRTRAAGWEGVVPPEARPRLDDPPRGYLVTANQRVVEDDGPAAHHLGGTGGTPDRARRITERLDALLSEKKPTAEELLAIQQDTTSVEGRELAPLLGRHCPGEVAGHPPWRARAFCKAVREFRGRYDTGSIGALAFTQLLDELRAVVLEAHFGAELGQRLTERTFLRAVVETALREEEDGRPSPLFDDPKTPTREGPGPFVVEAARRALDFLVAKAGGDPADWRWGKLHRLSFKGPLAAVPVLGAFFETDPQPETGHRSTIRSERGLPVTHGSAMRMVVEMSAPPSLRMVIDTGQSGHAGHPHFADQVPLWRAGKPFPIATDRAEIEREAEGRLSLSP